MQLFSIMQLFNTLQGIPIHTISHPCTPEHSPAHFHALKHTPAHPRTHQLTSNTPQHKTQLPQHTPSTHHQATAYPNTPHHRANTPQHTRKHHHWHTTTHLQHIPAHAITIVTHPSILKHNPACPNTTLYSTPEQTFNTAQHTSPHFQHTAAHDRNQNLENLISL